jgi:hypothetical protein
MRRKGSGPAAREYDGDQEAGGGAGGPEHELSVFHSSASRLSEFQLYQNIAFCHLFKNGCATAAGFRQKDGPRVVPCDPPSVSIINFRSAGLFEFSLSEKPRGSGRAGRPFYKGQPVSQRRSGADRPTAPPASSLRAGRHLLALSRALPLIVPFVCPQNRPAVSAT